MRKTLWALAIAVAASGCYKNTYMTTKPQGGAIHTQKAVFFLWGLVGEENVDLKSICPQGVAWFQNRMEPVDWVLGCLTCGIYQPLTVEVRCASGSAYLAVPDVDQNVTWFYDLPESEMSSQMRQGIELETVATEGGEL